MTNITKLTLGLIGGLPEITNYTESPIVYHSGVPLSHKDRLIDKGLSPLEAEELLRQLRQAEKADIEVDFDRLIECLPPKPEPIISIGIELDFNSMQFSFEYNRPLKQRGVIPEGFYKSKNR